MSETKYFYLMFKENFFDNDDLVFLEGMPDGYLYSNILLKLYLKSLKNQGKLMYKDRIPYNAEMLAKSTRHLVGVVEKALKIFQEMGIIEILDNGAIYMLDIQNYIGKSSTTADRQRIYDRRIQEDKHLLKGNIKKSCKKSHEHTKTELYTEIETEINNISYDICVSDLLDTIKGLYNKLNYSKKFCRTATYKKILTILKAKDKRKLYPLEIIYSYNQYLNEKYNDEVEVQYIKGSDVFLTSSIYDYVDKIKEIFEKEMINKYGAEWKKIKFNYIE